MEVKIDTKEKFTTVTPSEAHLYDNMAADLAAACNNAGKPAANIVLNLRAVTGMDEKLAASVAALQQQFYETNRSFVICELQPAVEEIFDRLELLEFLNVTPTESEAWDIVQMEEIERELMDGDDVDFDVND